MSFVYWLSLTFKIVHFQRNQSWFKCISISCVRRPSSNLTLFFCYKNCQCVIWGNILSSKCMIVLNSIFMSNRFHWSIIKLIIISVKGSLFESGKCTSTWRLLLAQAVIHEFSVQKFCSVVSMLRYSKGSSNLQRIILFWNDDIKLWERSFKANLINE